MTTHTPALAERLHLADVARLEGVTVTTVWRWMHYGIQGIRLKSWRLAGRRFTNQEELDRFVKRMTEATTGCANSFDNADPETDAAIAGLEAKGAA